MPTTVFLSIRGEGASRALESFRRALGEEGASLSVVPTNDDNGYHGSAEVSDLAAAREAFAVARKPFPAMKAYLGVAGRDDAPLRPATQPAPDARPPRAGEQRSRGAERPQDGRGRGGEQKGRSAERGREREGPAEGAERGPRRAPLRGRNRNAPRPATGEESAQ